MDVEVDLEVLSSAEGSTLTMALFNTVIAYVHNWLHAHCQTVLQSKNNSNNNVGLLIRSIVPLSFYGFIFPHRENPGYENVVGN